MYDINNILLPDDYIGNSLSSMNISYDKLESWTNNIILSSERRFQPLVDFYDYYRDFWKSSVNFSIAINAIDRLTDLNTLITTNSAKFVKPITIIYPDLFEYNNITYENHKNTVIDWFKTKYPVSTNSNVFFPEKSIAYVYMMFYNEQVKVNKTLADNNRTIIQSVSTCTTNNVATTISCLITYKSANGKLISCVDYEPQISSNVCKSNSQPCTNNISVTCAYDNNSHAETRIGRLNIDEYFKDRSENDKTYIIKMIVENCEWIFDGIVPYYE